MTRHSHLPHFVTPSSGLYEKNITPSASISARANTPASEHTLSRRVPYASRI